VGDPDPLSQARVEEAIMELTSELRRINADHYRVTQQAAEARYRFKVAYARAYRAAEGTGPQREATATVECDTELHERETAEALEKALSHAGVSVRAQLDGLRSICANLRSAISHVPGEGG
jgi:hypothetical protein